MRTRVLAAAAVLAGAVVAVPSQVAAAPPAHSGDTVRTWTGLALDTVRAVRAGDAESARAYAMVDAAMYDAVNGLVPTSQRRAPAIVAPGKANSGDQAVAAATAAHDVLSALYPTRAAGYDAQLAADLAAAPAPGSAKHGQEWGSEVAAGVLAARTNDGSSPVESQVGSTEVGKFNQTWSGTQYRNLKPFAIADPTAYEGSGPPALTSPEYAAAFNTVKFLGDMQRSDPSADATFQYWSLGGGTEQPPGAWLRVAGTVSAQRDLSLADTARLFALESMALADTVAPTYATKVHYQHWRPVQAIARAEEDGNPATSPTPYQWVARGGTSGSPEYWSGHSSFSAAGATMLARFFCQDDIPFTLVTGSSNGVARSYPSFSAAAAEAGLSRVLGGLHFPFSNTSGLAAGQDVADEVADTALLPQRSVGDADVQSCGEDQ